MKTPWPFCLVLSLLDLEQKSKIALYFADKVHQMDDLKVYFKYLGAMLDYEIFAWHKIVF